MTDRLSYQDLADTALMRTKAPGLKRLPTSKAQVFIWSGFLDAASCEQIIALANPHLNPSTVVQGSDMDPYFRTSSTCYLGRQSDPLVGSLEARIAAALGLPLDYGESIQAQAYEVGQEFKAHTDYFEPGHAEYERHIGTGGQRSWTFMIYLNDVAGGGHTDFVELGRRVKPRQGRAVIWNNLDAAGAVNPFTKHHGTPVTEGRKVIITKWFRDRPRR